MDKYITPAMDVEKFDKEDVITTSGTSGTGDLGNGDLPGGGTIDLGGAIVSPGGMEAD